MPRRRVAPYGVEDMLHYLQPQEIESRQGIKPRRGYRGRDRELHCPLSQGIVYGLLLAKLEPQLVDAVVPGSVKTQD